MAYRTQVNALFLFTGSVKRIQLRNDQMEEMHRVRFGRLECRSSVHWVGELLPSILSCSLAQWHSPCPISLFQRFYRAQSPAPHSSLEVGWDCGWKCQPFNLLAFLVTSCILRLVTHPKSAYYYKHHIHDYWENHSFDDLDLRWQSDVYFLIRCLDLS